MTLCFIRWRLFYGDRAWRSFCCRSFSCLREFIPVRAHCERCFQGSGLGTGISGDLSHRGSRVGLKLDPVQLLRTHRMPGCFAAMRDLTQGSRKTDTWAHTGVPLVGTSKKSGFLFFAPEWLSACQSHEPGLRSLRQGWGIWTAFAEVERSRHKNQLECSAPWGCYPLSGMVIQAELGERERYIYIYIYMIFIYICIDLKHVMDSIHIVLHSCAYAKVIRPTVG